jgi:hypothetical protein
MRVVLAVAAIVSLTCASSATARTEGYKAYVSGAPRVQVAGRTYVMRIDVRNTGATVRPFCIDFGDDKNSWVIEMPGLSSWDSDGFCLGTFKARAHKVLRARVIAAKTGAHKMSVTLGKAKIYRSIHRFVIDDKNALYWEQQFVIVG